MPTVSISHNLNSMIALVGKYKKQVPFAVSQAVNAVAFELRREYGLATRIYFDRPTPGTEKGWRVVKSNKRQRPIRAMVHAAAHTAPYLKRQVVQSGPQGRAIPRRSGTNRYGNMPRGYINKRANRDGFFIGVPRNSTSKPYGLYQRLGPPDSMPAGRRLKMHIEFDKQVHHSPRFPLQRIGVNYCRKHLESRFYEHYRKAVRNIR